MTNCSDSTQRENTLDADSRVSRMRHHRAAVVFDVHPFRMAWCLPV
jgi:hypothetical protein